MTTPAASLPLPRFLWLTALLVLLGAAGGFLASSAGLPMPWMLGSLLASGGMVLLVAPRALDPYVFPNELRSHFVALIGVMIGTQVTPELLGLAGDLPLTLVGLASFVLLAHGGNYLIFKRIAGYDRTTAFYSGTPGGLMESIVMGEAAGADIRVLMAQQFLRIIFVITLLPLGLSLWFGEAVGSASGLSASDTLGPVGPLSLVLIGAAAVLGLRLGRLLRLPAAQLTGPLLIAATATLTGVLDLHLPFWLIAFTQLMIGVTLGLRFKGTDSALLRRSAVMSLISVLFMLCLGGLLSLGLARLTGLDFLLLFLSFAPGGVAEMSVVALSLAVSPALVSLHHIVRILMTVTFLGLLQRRVKTDAGSAP